MAASSRFGGTSVACHRAEVSIATITVARSKGTRSATSGRAAARPSGDSASSTQAAGRCRRQPGGRGTTVSSIGRVAKRTA